MNGSLHTPLSVHWRDARDHEVMVLLNWLKSTDRHRPVGKPDAGNPHVRFVPAVPVRKSITPGFLICLDDGKKFKSLRRHLRNLGMTPDQYREKWGLPKDYPMVAPEYAATRSALAKKIGLGRLVNDAGEPESEGTPEAVPEEVAT